MSESKKLPKGWRWARVDSLLSLEYGKAFPKAGRRDGPYAVYGSNGIVDRAHTYLIEDETIIVGRKGSAGEICIAEPKSWPIDTTYYVELNNHGIDSIQFIYYLLLWFDPRHLVDPSVKPGLNRDRVYENEIPLPPLAVQERIVEILQQADAIRRKRAEARHLADQILPALFFDLFGDPIKNQRGWPLRRIGSFCRVVRGAHPRPAGDPRYFNGDVPIAYISDVTAEPSRTLRRTKLTVTEDGKRKSRFLKEGTLVVTGNTTTGIPKVLGMDCCVHDGFRAFTELTNEVERDYLYWYFRNTVEFYEHLTLGDGLRGGLKVSDYEDFEIPFPPKPYQVQLAETLNRAEDILLGQLEALPMQENTFSVLLSRAFTGELTAEWEAANAEWIAERQSFYERLPRLALLTLLLERRERAGQNAVTLITALMKYAFLVQMEGELRRRLYRFKPYHYGPCAMELYDDLKVLTADGLIAVENDTKEEKTRITLTDPERAAALLEEAARQDDGRVATLEQTEEDSNTPVDPAMVRMLKRRAEIFDALRSDVATILNAYGDLDHNALLKTVYEKYPAYAVKSRLLRNGL